jgi:hypothetical protein
MGINKINVSSFSFQRVKGMEDRLVPQHLENLKGPSGKLGVKVYSTFIGKFLSLFKKTVIIEDKNHHTWYVNRNSLEGWKQTNAQRSGVDEVDLNSFLSKMVDPLVLSAPVSAKETARLVLATETEQKQQIIMDPSVFGKEQWTKYFGDVGVAPPLPAAIDDILASPCPIFPDKTVGESHVLILIPKTIDDKTLTLNLLAGLIKAPKPGSGGHAAAYLDFDQDVVSTRGSTPAGESHWVLMTNDVLPESRKKKFADQQAMIGDLVAKKGINYEVPQVLDAAVCIFMQYVNSAERLYSDDPLTYTACQEEVNGYRVVVGGFRPEGLCISNVNVGGNEHNGIAALRKL